MFLVVLTPLSVAWHWPEWVSAVLLFTVLILLLFAGQTVIFLLRLVAADRRGRRRPLASETKTVGELEDEGVTEPVSSPPPSRGPRATIGAASRPIGVCRRIELAVPVLATYFSVRRGRDPFFKFFMRTIFPKQVKEYEERFGIRFIGWYNVAHGWDFDNVILLDLPDYATLDKLRQTRARAPSGTGPGNGSSNGIIRCSCASAWDPISNTTPRPMSFRRDVRDPREQGDEPNGRQTMETGRNDLLGELARDAELERSDFIVQSTEQLRRFLDATAAGSPAGG